MKDQTHILAIIDRSGSMGNVRDDAEAAFNSFLDEQRGIDGDCVVTLWEFDDRIDRLYSEQDIRYTHNYSLEPRGWTALHDAIGRAVTDLGRTLAAKKPEQRPDKVVVIVQTDGLENFSKEWDTEKVRALVAQQQDVYGWQFVFLGMGPDTWDTGKTLNFRNNVRASGSSESYGGTYAVASASVGDFRTTGTALNVDADIS